jgi:hypothetical protein
VRAAEAGSGEDQHLCTGWVDLHSSIFSLLAKGGARWMRRVLQGCMPESHIPGHVASSCNKRLGISKTAHYSTVAAVVDAQRCVLQISTAPTRPADPLLTARLLPVVLCSPRPAAPGLAIL